MLNRSFGMPLFVFLRTGLSEAFHMSIKHGRTLFVLTPCILGDRRGRVGDSTRHTCDCSGYIAPKGDVAENMGTLFKKSCSPVCPFGAEDWYYMLGTFMSVSF